MVDWKNALKKVQRAVDIIQANPVYNQIVNDALDLVPVAACNRPDLHRIFSKQGIRSTPNVAIQRIKSADWKSPHLNPGYFKSLLEKRHSHSNFEGNPGFCRMEQPVILSFDKNSFF